MAPLEDIKDEIVDMIKLKDLMKITLKNIIHGKMDIKIVLDLLYGS